MHTIYLVKAKPDEFDTFWKIEQSAADSPLYSSNDEDEAREEFKTCEVYFIHKDDIVVGAIWYEKKSSEHAYISGTIVLPEYQGQGIGKEAKRLLVQGPLKDMHRIDATVHPHNSANIRIYLSLGFIIESWIDDCYGDGEPRLVLVKLNK